MNEGERRRKAQGEEGAKKRRGKALMLTKGSGAKLASVVREPFYKQLRLSGCCEKFIQGAHYEFRKLDCSC